MAEKVDIEINQAAVNKFLIPVEDVAGQPVNLSTMEGVAWTLGRNLSMPGDITKRPGDEGCEIVTDTQDQPGAENNALLITLSAKESNLPGGKLYHHAAWIIDAEGPVPVVTGQATVVPMIWPSPQEGE